MSRWRSHQEKVEHTGQRPYRCCICAHRFIATDSLVNRRHWRGPVVVLLPALLSIGLGLGLWVLLPALPVMLQQPGENTQDEVTQADERLTTAARQGNPEAQYRLARVLLHDRSRGQQAAQEALQWLDRAAAGGHAAAMLQLGRLHRTGQGVLQNFDLAVHWTSRAASIGNTDAMMDLGRLYRSGTGVRQDLIEAYAWFNRAASALHVEALGERESLALRLSAAELKMAQERSAQLPVNASLSPAPDATNGISR